MESQEQAQVKTYTLYPNEIEIIHQAAEERGERNLSAALRFIIREWSKAQLAAQREQQEAG